MQTEQTKTFLSNIKTLSSDQNRIHQQDFDKSYNEKFESVKAHQIQKLNEQYRSSNKTHHDSVRAVFNISNCQVSDFEETVLKELNFTTIIRYGPSRYDNFS